MPIVSPNHPSQIAAQQANTVEVSMIQPAIERNLAHVALSTMVRPDAVGGNFARGTLFANHHLSETIRKRVEKP